MKMHNPPHPGLSLKLDVLPALGLSVTEAADQLGVSRVQFSRVINGAAAISPEMALRLQQWIPGPSASGWLAQQAAFDLWQAEHKPAAPRVAPAQPAPGHSLTA